MAATSVSHAVQSSATSNAPWNYWLIKNRKTGHAVVSRGNDPTSKPILQALGVSKASDVQTYNMGHDFQSGLFAGLNKLQLSIDTIPTTFQPKSGTDIQGLNFDLLAPIGTDKNKLQQTTSSVGSTIASTVSVAALFTSPSLWKGVGLALAGAILVILGLSQFVKRAS